MSSLKDPSLQRLEQLCADTSLLLCDRAADQLSTILSTAYAAAHSNNPEVQKHSLDIIKRAFLSLWEAIDTDEGPPEDPRYKWLNEHPEIVTQYRGKHIVWGPSQSHPNIIAVGDSFQEVHDKVKDHPEVEKLCFDCIPDDMAFAGAGSDL